jgi:hypothetical protein
MPLDYANGIRDMVALFSSMRSSSKFRQSSSTCGEPWIKRACPTKCFGYGEVVDVFLQKKRDGKAAKRFFK